MWKDWKDVMPVCVELTVLLGRRLEKVGIEFSPSEPTSLWWTTLAEWVSSARIMSTGLAAPDSRDPLSCATISSSDPLKTRSGPRVGIQSRSSSGVARLLDGDPNSGTSSSMKSNAAPSETAEPR
jgi:hypothetical protein